MRTTRYRTYGGGEGSGPACDDPDVTTVDSLVLADAMAGVLGPFNAPDSLTISDTLVADDLSLGDSIAVADAMDDIRGLRVRDSIDLADRLAGTLGPIAAPDSFDLQDKLVGDDLSLDDSIQMSDAPNGQWATEAQAQDTIALADAPEASGRFLDSIAVADALDDIGRLGIAESIDFADRWGALTDTTFADSFDLADARTAGQVTARPLDSFDTFDLLRRSDLVVVESIDIADLMQQADVDMTNWADVVLTGSFWDNSANAVDTDTATFSTSQVTSSGVGGITSESETGTLDLGYPDPTSSLSPFVWDSVVLEYRWRTRTQGTQVTAGTVSYTVRYSLNNGGSYTNIETITAVSSDPGQKTTDLTGIANTLTELQQFRFKMDGTITSGTGLGKTQLIDCFYARLVISAHRTF